MVIDEYIHNLKCSADYKKIILKMTSNKSIQKVHFFLFLAITFRGFVYQGLFTFVESVKNFKSFDTYYDLLYFKPPNNQTLLIPFGT